MYIVVVIFKSTQYFLIADGRNFVEDYDDTETMQGGDYIISHTENTGFFCHKLLLRK